MQDSDFSVTIQADNFHHTIMSKIHFIFTNKTGKFRVQNLLNILIKYYFATKVKSNGIIADNCLTSE